VLQYADCISTTIYVGQARTLSLRGGLQFLGGFRGIPFQEIFENLGEIYAILVKFYCDAVV